jgi:teichuronic acid biosynthesis glycosyltransferase TuaC
MLKVLTFSTLFPHADSPNLGIFVENQTRRLAESGKAEVRVIAPLGIAPWPLSLHPRYAPLHKLPHEEMRSGLRVHRPRYSALPGIGWRFNDLAIFRACVPVMEQMRRDGFHFDIIDGEFFFPCGIAAALLARHFNVPLSIKARGADIHFWPTLPGVADKVRMAGATASGMLCVSQSLKRDMVALGLEADKIRVHYTGIELDRFAPVPRKEARAALGLPEGPLIVSVGALIPRKGHGLLIDAVAQLPGVHLRIAGQGDEKASLQAQIEKLGISDRVKLLGPLPYASLPALYSAADISALCCESEGLANVWVESMACGTPVVTFDVDGAPEAITHADAGRLILPEQRTAEAVSAALADLISNRAPPENVRAQAQRFSWANNSRTLIDHLHACAQKKSPAI